MGGASCMLMRKAARLTRVATGGQASEHRVRAMTYVGEHVVVRALEGDAPLFIAADFSLAGMVYRPRCTIWNRLGRSKSAAAAWPRGVFYYNIYRAPTVKKE